jgi:ATP-dependent protease ClpP protease subunit
MDKRPFRTTRRIANLREGRNDWYRIRNAAATGGPAVLHIFDEIGFFGVTAADLVRDLAGVSGDLDIHMNCPGGDVFEGLAIYNTLSQRKGTVSVFVDGLAASAASFIAQAASPGKLAIAKTASMMIHDAFGMGIGNAKDMRDLAQLLDEQSDVIAGIYADRSGQPAAYWREQMRAESWYTGAAAVDAGLADMVQGTPAAAAVAVAASWDLSIFARRPAHLRDASGSGPVDPDGDGDDDSTPEGDTDHDYWDEDGNQIQDLPGRPVPRPQDRTAPGVRNADKYKQADRDRMAKSGEAMPDGSYPIADEEDLDNAIHAVGRGGDGHDAIRRHIIKRAAALGLSSKIPDNWDSDGSLKDLSEHAILALFTGQQDQHGAGRE